MEGTGSATDNLGVLWQEALTQLRLLLPDATFDALFADTAGARADGGLVVQVGRPEAKAWIEARLQGPVQEALRAAGYSGPIQFQLLPAASRVGLVQQLPTPGPSELAPGDVALAFLNFDLYARGWLRTPSYYELFWQPILGYLPYAYWRLMQVLYWRNSTEQFTPLVRLDIQSSAGHLGVSRDLVRGKPAQGLGGALKTLSDHGLAKVERHAAGRATIYTGRFRRQFPLLTPAQVALLKPTQQRQHLDWLLSAGYDPAAWESQCGDHASLVHVTEQPPATEPYINPPWESERLSQAGFLRTPVYYDLFLQPLVGSVAYAIWRVCKCLNWSSGGQLYTQDTVTSIYALAATLNCHRQKIIGVKRRQNGIGYWQDGAFDRLRQERLALIREEGQGSSIAYRLLVVNEPPLSCPNQVTRFSARMQEAHADWLRKAQLRLGEWQQLSLDSLLALVGQD